MAKLAIKGHETRGEEVIKLLEMMGGKSNGNIKGYNDDLYYYIAKDGLIYGSGIKYEEFACNYTIFTLEEFEEKFPYKVGDEVEHKSIGDANLKSKIIYMEWCNALNKVLYTTEDAQVISTEDITETKSIPPYTDYDIKEDKAKAPDLKGEDYSGRRFGYKIPNGYEFECVRKNEIILKPIKPQYPKTYEECYDILGLLKPSDDDSNIYGYKTPLLSKFQKLLICRDAYWKIAGEQMGLGKPWNQVYKDRCFIISNCSGNIHIYEYHGSDNVILAFPTAEMRDEFYDNFRDLIESCKDLL